MDIATLALLGGTGALAGFVDAIAGGGGMVALPMLLSVGIPPVSALATNKMQSVFGTTTAAVTYWRKGFVDPRTLIAPIAATYAGSLSGALTVKSLDTSFLSVVVPVALIAIALYFTFAPKLTNEDRHARLDMRHFLPLVGFAIGYYDGVFGPGTGSFFTVVFVTLFGLGLTRATGHTKMLNMTSNLAALTLFIPSGDVVWPAALVMAACQIAGGYAGAMTGIRFGARIIRPLVIVVSIVLAVRLLVT